MSLSRLGVFVDSCDLRGDVLHLLRIGRLIIPFDKLWKTLTLLSFTALVNKVGCFEIDGCAWRFLAAIALLLKIPHAGLM